MMRTSFLLLGTFLVLSSTCTTIHAQEISFLLTQMEQGVRLSVSGQLTDLSGLTTTATVKEPDDETTTTTPAPPYDPCGDRFDIDGNYIHNFFHVDHHAVSTGDWCGGGDLYKLLLSSATTTTLECPVMMRAILELIAEERFPVVGFQTQEETNVVHVWLPVEYAVGTPVNGAALLPGQNLTSMLSLADTESSGPLCSFSWLANETTVGTRQTMALYVGDALPTDIAYDDEEENVPEVNNDQPKNDPFQQTIQLFGAVAILGALAFVMFS